MSLFEFLSIKETVTHEVFKRNIDKQIVTPNYGGNLITLDVKSTSTLQERIVSAMTNDTHCIEMSLMENNSNSASPTITGMFNCTAKDFIDKSKLVTDCLAQSQQTRRIPGGALVILRGITGSERKKFIAIIKAEMQEGFIKESTKSSITIKHLTDLLLTPQQKLYKIGLFVDNGEEKNPTVFIYDQTMTANETRSAATYFYNNFLGCTFSQTDKKLTSDFYNYTNQFIDKLDINEEDKLDLKTSLYTYLKISNSTTIKTSDFANQFLEKDHKPLFDKHMKEKEFPTTAVNKDLTFLKNKLRRRKVKFNSGVKIDAPQEEFSTLVQIEGYKNGYTELKIKGSIHNDE